MPNKQQITHDNHYVPQLYLKLWGNDAMKVCVYNSVIKHHSEAGWKRVSIKGTAYFRDYYTDEIDGEDDDKVEHFFKTYEDAAKPAFDRILRGEAMLDCERRALIEFVIVQISRTPSFYAFSNQLNADNFESAFGEAMQQLKIQSSEIKDNNFLSKIRDCDRYLPLKVKPGMDDHTAIGEFCIGRHSFLFSSLVFKDGIVAKLLRSSDWRLVKSSEFILTSDNPVVFLRYNAEAKSWHTGLRAQPGDTWPIVYMPVSPHAFLMTALFAPKEEIDKLAEMAAGDSELFQQGIVQNAYRYIYAIHEDERVLRWRNQRVDKDLYYTLEARRKTWHKSNLDREKDFFPRKTNLH